MAPDCLLQTLSKLGARNVRILLQPRGHRFFDGNAEALLLLAHSAAGKSAILKHLRADRYFHDMDVFCQRNKHLAPLEALEAMLTEPPPERILVLRNQPEFLSKLSQHLAMLPARDLQLLYLRRPPEVIERNLAQPNTDGLRHRLGIASVGRKNYYAHMEQQYRSLASIEVEYPGDSVPELSGIVTSLRDVATYQALYGGAGDSAVIQELKGYADLEEHFIWYLDYPSADRVPALEADGLLRLAGWAAARSGDRLRLAVRQGSQVSLRDLSVVREDAAEFIRARPGYATPDARCGFDLRVELNDFVELGVATTDRIFWVARIAPGRTGAGGTR